MTQILRYAAFTLDPAGGNPAGVVLDASTLSDARMLQIAAEVGYSETAFLTAADGDRYRVRYFSPLVEVPFCGHATVATAVALGPGEHVFTTNAGDVPVSVDEAGVATLSSVRPRVGDLGAADLAALLTALRWDAGDLDPALPPRVAYAGAYHPILAVTSRKRLAELDYDVPALTALMTARGWTTVQLVFRESAETFDVRDPFPVGGVYEDPATGAAAAALGGYLRELELVPAGAELLLRQGDDMGRPSRVTVRLVPGNEAVLVSGPAVPIS
ncbi:PhzF family phenazine biosynthesis protein [Actinoplanes campanulatus]|uniref:PhzF family phenazine biosynthesis protein n=1 Tax=Actinoplanes campanulatus TaxID=113559 RepID=A0A7W5AFE1_9ACTN|nr:PhzF family phenazine biosynthesis isomerase [Actinoplanes campanulatus]MBB3094769.1 PhzF family phenazine biosynthesis protein [Actinoplanes campanulatus]GGN07366.1 oxidoreductase [Actinoplanes campanulatus]GID36065.1 oxidoreductase [Actinoplanes campanulatus]